MTNELVVPETGELVPQPPVAELESQFLHDWQGWYRTAGQRRVTPQQQTALLTEIPDAELEILPTGEVYASQIRYRRILNESFGPGGWAMIPKGEYTKGETIIYREYVLVAEGRFISEAMGSAEYQEKNSRMTWADAAEALKSNALMRCCKDLGIASRCWDRPAMEVWKDTYAVQVWVEGKTRPQWRRKDQKPFYNERTVKPEEQQTSTTQTDGATTSTVISPKQASRVFAIWANEAKLDPKDLNRWLQAQFQVKDYKSIPSGDLYDDVVMQIQQGMAAKWTKESAPRPV